MADELAKEAIKEGLEYKTLLSKSFIKKHLHKQCIDEWNAQWNMAGKQSYTYQWIKNVRLIPKHFPLDYYTTQAVTAHGRFPFYFKRFHITNGDRCPCGEDAESFDHYLDSCKLTKTERDIINKKFKKPSNSKYEIICKKELVDTISEMVRAINEKVFQV